MTKIFEALEKSKQDKPRGTMGNGAPESREDRPPAAPDPWATPAPANGAASGGWAAAQPANGAANTSPHPAPPDWAAPQPSNGAPTQGAPDAGASHQGAPANGTPHQGAPSNGTLRSAIRPAVGGASAANVDLKLERPLTVLYQNISALLPDMDSRVLMFLESRPKEGAEVLAREFVKTCAFKLNKRVLLMDAHQGRFNLLPMNGKQLSMGWGEAEYTGTPLNQAVVQIGSSNMFYTQVASRPGLPPVSFDSPRIGDIIGELKREFEIVVIVTPPAVISADGLLLSRRVDGVVLVVEADKTRYQVVERIRDQVYTNSGNLLGVILNKRHFPIPRAIYKYL